MQDYIRGRALQNARRTPDGYRLLLFDVERLVAVGAHAEGVLILTDGVVVATRLVVVAIAAAYQGRVLEDGGRLSDVVIATLIADARFRETELVTAIVAGENLRSIALCERNGLRAQIRYGQAYVRLTGRVHPSEWIA